ncbi:peptide methionine sulfoxide reductase MsrA isoform X3 [Caretta caretta]|uniref:peptide methionine sulfoxide reductase MsrA isoform X3 n=1 Tax=Caretta caretta TaxID=8467 RepID=UPI003F4B4B48
MGWCHIKEWLLLLPADVLTMAGGGKSLAPFRCEISSSCQPPPCLVFCRLLSSCPTPLSLPPSRHSEALRRRWAQGRHLGGVRLAPARAVGGRPTLRGLTGHAEVVRVVYDPQKTSYEALLKAFWENHDPTQGMQQEEDVGTQYRSVIHTFGAQQWDAALKSKAMYQQELAKRQLGPITTEIQAAGEFYHAEDYHQQYLHKTPKGYCGQKGTGVACPICPAAEQES